MQTLTRQYVYQSAWPKVIHDRPLYDPTLQAHMRDAMELFKLRVAELGDMAHATSANEEDELRLMLNVLITAKQALQGKRS